MIKIKNIFDKQSIIQVTLLKVILSIFLFLIIVIILYGKIYWERQTLRMNYNSLLTTLDLRSRIQSQIDSVQEVKENNNLTEEQKILELKKIVEPIINNKSNNNNPNDQNNCDFVAYYDLDLNALVKNNDNSNCEFDEFTINKLNSQVQLDNSISEFVQLKLNIGASVGDSIPTEVEIRTPTYRSGSLGIDKKGIVLNIPLYYKDKLTGYLVSYTENSHYIFNSFQEFSLMTALALSLSLLIIILLQKNFRQVEIYLQNLCKQLITNDCSEQATILTKFPELEPVSAKITFFAENLKQTNQELETSKLRITKIMEGISDGFYALDRNWLFTFVNNKIKVFSKDDSQLIGKNIWEVFPQVRHSLIYDKLNEAMDQNESVHWEAEGLSSPVQTYEYHAYPYKDGLTVFFRDITELKRQQQELGRLERLNLIGQLAAGISHEIRNPLTTVKGFLQFFGAKSKYSQDKESMELMISEIDSANDIITDFLSLSKVSLDNIKLQNINETINKLFPILQADAYNSNKEIVIDLSILPAIMINENEIKQLILNLVRNALDVTPEQGSVIISTFSKEDKVVLAIKDQGPGIPLEIQEKIGTPFFTTKETGTGLGLAISMGIAQRHEAVFEFQTGDEGTVFSILFQTL